MVVLPSSPVWYQTRGADTSHDGILAFGSRNLIYLLDLTQKRPEIYGILSGHTDKVTSCSFCVPSTQDQLLKLASGADDCSVKVWDAQQKLVLKEHSKHGANKIVSVHWSQANPNLIFSGDEKGIVFMWYLDEDHTCSFFPDGTSQMNLCSLTCSPYQENIVAIGYKSGAVSLMDVRKKGTVVMKLRGHTNEIHGIVWAPEKNENSIFSDNQSQGEAVHGSGIEGVIVTGSKDKTIKLWSTKEGRCRKTLRVPNRVVKGRKVNEDIARLYVTVYWPPSSDSRFISSGYNGDLIVWDLSPGAENLFEVLATQPSDAGHQRIVFNISHGSNVSNTIVSTSMDRQLLHWTIPDQSPSKCRGPDWTLPTLGGFVYSISVAPRDPSVVAIGVGDGMIRIWKTRHPKSAYDITTLWQGVKEKVMAMAWHPTKEGSLAFATEDGKVGIYDTLTAKPPVIAEKYHLKPVYALSWGPKCVTKSVEVGAAAETLNLYSCGGDGVILQHDPDMSNHAIDIDPIIATSNSGQGHHPGKHSEVSWTQDGRFLAIGDEIGTIGIYTSPHLCHIIEIRCHTKIVNCIRWRPSDGLQDDGLLEVASGSNNSTIFIHDIKKVFADHCYTIGDNIDKPILVKKPSRSLEGHIARITGLSYNPRNPAEIVSSSYDGTAQVWNTEAEKPLWNFRGHHGRVMCVAWTSVINESTPDKKSGIIYTGADDYTVHGWHAEEQQDREPPKTLPDFGFGLKNRFPGKKKGKSKKVVQPAKNVLANGELAIDTPTNDAKKQQLLHQSLNAKKEELLGMIENGFPKTPEVKLPSPNEKTSHPVNTESYPKSEPRAASVSLIETGHEKPQEEGRKRKRLKNMFPQTVAMDNRKKADQHQDCIKIIQWKMKHPVTGDEDKDLSFLPGEPEHINLGLYTDRRSAFRMMKNESNKLQEDEIMEGSCNIRLWMGDVIGTIEDATEKGQLTDQLVALAPMAGQWFWRKTAHAFAEQLIGEDHHLHAVQYLLVCNKVYEAVKVLLDGRHYREAVALARARLCDDDPLLKETVKSWGQKLRYGGSVELAAKCFASIGEFEEAANAISLRATSGASNIADSDIASLWAAASVATAAGKTDCASGFADRALNTVCARTWNWSDNGEVLSSFPNLQHYRFIAMVHEVLTTRLLTKGDLKPMPTMKKSQWNKARSSLDFQEVIQSVWATQREHESGDAMFGGFDKNSCVRVHSEALIHKQDQVTESKVLFQVSYSLSAALFTRLTTANESTAFESDSGEAELDFLSEDIWVDHLLNAFTILSKLQSLEQYVVQELVLIICEITMWAAKERGPKPEEKIAQISERKDSLASPKSTEPEAGDVSDKVASKSASEKSGNDLQVITQGVNFLLNKVGANEELSTYLGNCLKW